MLRKVALRGGRLLNATSAASRGASTKPIQRLSSLKQRELHSSIIRSYSVRVNDTSNRGNTVSAPAGLSAEVTHLYDTLKTGNRRSLAKAITLGSDLTNGPRKRENTVFLPFL
jgi:hypothetical protein